MQERVGRMQERVGRMQETSFTQELLEQVRMQL